MHGHREEEGRALLGLAPLGCCFSGMSREADPAKLSAVSGAGGTSLMLSSVDSLTSQNPNSFTLPAQNIGGLFACTMQMMKAGLQEVQRCSML